MRSLTTMLPLSPSSRPASLARAVSGVTPMASTTKPAWRGASSLSSTSTPLPWGAKPSTVRPRASFIPCLRTSPWIKAAMSGSKGFISWRGRW